MPVDETLRFGGASLAQADWSSTRAIDKPVLYSARAEFLTGIIVDVNGGSFMP